MIRTILSRLVGHCVNTCFRRRDANPAAEEIIQHSRGVIDCLGDQKRVDGCKVELIQRKDSAGPKSLVQIRVPQHDAQIFIEDRFSRRSSVDQRSAVEIIGYDGAVKSHRALVDANVGAELPYRRRNRIGAKCFDDAQICSPDGSGLREVGMCKHPTGAVGNEVGALADKVGISVIRDTGATRPEVARVLIEAMRQPVA